MKVLTTTPNVKRRSPGTIVAIQTDEDRERKRAAQVQSSERAKARKRVLPDPKLFNVKQHKNWLV